MKSALALAVLLVGFVCLATAAPPNFEKINISAVLNNRRVLDNYLNCLLDKGKCNDTGREIKRKCFLLYSVFSKAYALLILICHQIPLRDSICLTIFSQIRHSEILNCCYFQNICRKLFNMTVQNAVMPKNAI